MKTLLLIGEYYSDNLGDGILCQTVERYIQSKIDIKIQCFDMSLREYYVQNPGKLFTPWKKELVFFKHSAEKILTRFHFEFYRKRLNTYYQDYTSCLRKILETSNPSAILFAGGQMFKDTFITRVVITVKEASQRGIPVIFNACGCGNYLSPKSSEELSNALCSDCVKMISVRDGKSKISLLAGDNLQIIDTIDTAILSSQYFFIPPQKVTSKDRPIGVGVMFSKNHDVYMQIRFWKRIIRYLISKNEPFELFCDGDLTDYNFIKYLLKDMELPENQYLTARPVKPEELVKMISGYQAILSMRLHSLIVAYSLKLPSVAIAWDEKIAVFFKKIGCENYCLSFSSPVSHIYSTLNLCRRDPSYFDKRDSVLMKAKKNMTCVCNIIQSFNGPKSDESQIM